MKNLTKDFGARKGVFDLSFEVEDGEIFGLLGPDGSGKTTVMRQLMGFAAPGRGRCSINGKNCYSKAAEIKGFTGYIPEEISFPLDMTGVGFVRFMAEMKGIKSIERAQQLAERFELDLTEGIKKMSKASKQKLGIVCGFMHDPAVLLLDEPIGDLDSMMQGRFINLLHEEKARGKLVLLATHMFRLVERTCDRVGMMKNGLMINTNDIEGIRSSRKKTYMITFAADQDAVKFAKEDFEVISVNGRQVTVSLAGIMTPLIKVLGAYQVTGLEAISQRLEDVLMQFYGGDAGA